MEILNQFNNIRHCLRFLHLNISAIVLVLLVLSVTEARSEVVFRYGYDAAGNRVAREVVAQPRVAVASPPAVAVFPSITTGRVTIENRPPHSGIGPNTA